MRSLLKPARDAAADVVAALVFRTPAFEPWFIRSGRLIWRLPGVRTIYRRSVETLCERLRAAGRAYRWVRVGSHRLQFDVTEFTTRGLYFLSRPYEPGTIGWMLDHVRRSDVVVDVGAHHGYHTVIAAALVGESGHVYAFEPNPGTFAALRAHVRTNGFDGRVTAIERALSDRTEDGVPLYLSGRPDNSGVASLDADWEPETRWQNRAVARVRTESFDAWRRAAGVERIRLVKIDVEGAEDRVVAGMLATLDGAPPDSVICETRWGSWAHQMLMTRGYEAHVLDPIGELANILYRHRS